MKASDKNFESPINVFKDTKSKIFLAISTIVNVSSNKLDNASLISS